MSNSDEMQAFLTLEIDRVGEFIENSRKTLDAWLGSYILSYIMCEVARAVKKLPNAEVVYPALEEQPLLECLESGDRSDLDKLRISTFPDRLLAKIPLQAAKDCVNKATHAAEKAWQNVWQGSRKQLEAVCRGLAREADWTSQCEGFFKIHWAVTPITDPDEARSYERHLELMEAVNSSRRFSSIGQPGIKCSLCGNLSALPWSGGDPKGLWEDVAQMKQFRRVFEKHERLSAVYAAKRLAGHGFVSPQILKATDVGFPSTASLAAASVTAEAMENPDALAEFQKKLGGLRKVLDDHTAEAGIPRLLELADKDEAKKWLAKLDGEWLLKDNYRIQRLC
ncbi:MAG TPA: type III-B CRISPR-associated protein Cas10/Cmr2, partial [Acidobacteriota bacterium]|nr:type III-B CRISPR-associated protein Cas10/Cmr2 [Acidobacteriota bacterium]